jgi:hypothetical protein
MQGAGAANCHQCDPDRMPMTKSWPAKYGKAEARPRFDEKPRDVPEAPDRPLKMTATMKRRALKKKPSKLEFVAYPAID